MSYIIPSGLRRLSTAGLSDFGCTLSEKMTVPAGGNKWEWFKRYDSNSVTARTKYPNSPPHTSTSLLFAHLAQHSLYRRRCLGWLLFTKPIT